MKNKAPLILSPLLVLLALALSNSAYAGGNSNSDNSKGSSSYSSSSNTNGTNKGHGDDDDDDRNGRGHDDDHRGNGNGKGQGNGYGYGHNDNDDGDDDDDDDYGHNGGNKVQVCHLTSSATNPGVLITVSTNAAQAHYGHGDPLSFTNLPGGRCEAAGAGTPTVELFLSDNRIFDGGDVTVSWESFNTIECSLGNGETTGSIVLGPFSLGTYIVEVTCVNASDVEVKASAELTVVPITPPPR